MQPLTRFDIENKCFIPYGDVGQLVVIDVVDERDGQSSKLGDMSKLTTALKDNFVNAINEINNRNPLKWDPNGFAIDPTYGAYIHGIREKGWSGWLQAKDVGETKNLDTNDKTVVGAINELNKKEYELYDKQAHTAFNNVTFDQGVKKTEFIPGLNYNKYYQGKLWANKNIYHIWFGKIDKYNSSFSPTFQVNMNDDLKFNVYWGNFNNTCQVDIENLSKTALLNVEKFELIEIGVK